MAELGHATIKVTVDTAESVLHLRTMASRFLRLAAEMEVRPCRTCEGPSRETIGLVCPTCGWDYMNGEKR